MLACFGFAMHLDMRFETLDWKFTNWNHENRPHGIHIYIYIYVYIYIYIYNADRPEDDHHGNDADAAVEAHQERVVEPLRGRLAATKVLR